VSGLFMEYGRLRLSLGEMNQNNLWDHCEHVEFLITGWIMGFQFSSETGFFYFCYYYPLLI